MFKYHLKLALCSRILYNCEYTFEFTENDSNPIVRYINKLLQVVNSADELKEKLPVTLHSIIDDKVKMYKELKDDNPFENTGSFSKYETMEYLDKKYPGMYDTICVELLKHIIEED